MSGCADVCLYGEYDGMNDFHSTRTVRARKPHQCGECGSTINPGEHYQYVSAKSEGELWTMKTCADCAEIRRAFACDGPIYYEMLWEDMREQMFPVWREKGMWDCLAKLSIESAREKCRTAFAKWRDDLDE